MVCPRSRKNSRKSRRISWELNWLERGWVAFIGRGNCGKPLSVSGVSTVVGIVRIKARGAAHHVAGKATPHQRVGGLAAHREVIVDRIAVTTGHELARILQPTAFKGVQRGRDGVIVQAVGAKL